MTKSIHLFLFITSTLILFSSAKCKRDATIAPPATSQFSINLYKKPVDTILFYIQGKWKLEYEFGGICSTCKYDVSNYNYIWLFDSNSKVKQTTKDNTYTDTTITWRKGKDIHNNVDSIFIMKFFDNRGYPYDYIVDGIFNDSLQLHDANAVDALFYHFSKVR